MPPESTPGGGPRLAGGRKLVGLCATVFGLAVVFILLLNQHGLYQIYHLRQERTRLERENARLLEENTRLTRTIDRLHHDPEMIQDLIRRELNFVRKDEIIIQLPEAGGSKPPTGVMPQSRPGPHQHEKAGETASRYPARKATGASHRTP